MTRSSVVLPQPDGPMKETKSPSLTVRSTLRQRIDRPVGRFEGEAEVARLDHGRCRHSSSPWNAFSCPFVGRGCYAVLTI